MIELFLDAPLELKVIILSGLTLIIIELFKEEKSSWKKQNTGIRQGCTLSPYLFLIVMTVIVADVQSNHKLASETSKNRPPGMDFDEVLYADDTIIFSTEAQTVEKLLQEIEKCAEPYGLKLNQGKCESICTDPKKKFKIKTRNKKRTISRYGCKTKQTNKT